MIANTSRHCSSQGEQKEKNHEMLGIENLQDESSNTFTNYNHMGTPLPL